MTKDYRITIRRPIGGRMRAVGETVQLSDREYQAEAPWGGLEEVKSEDKPADAAPARVDLTVTLDPEVARRLASIETTDQPEHPTTKKNRR